jgi:hypothetical protein
MLYIPLAFLGLYKLLAGKPRVGWCILLGVAMGVQIFSSPYYTLYLGMVTLPVFALTYAGFAYKARTFFFRDLKPLAACLLGSAAIAFAVSSFYLIPRLGAVPQTFPPPTWLPYTLDNYLELLDPSDPFTFLGLPVFILAVLAIAWALRNRTPLRMALVATAAAALIMMLPAVPGSPHWIFYKLVPPFRHLRVPIRFFPIFNLMLLSLIALYLKEALGQMTLWRRRLAAGVILSSIMFFNWMASPYCLGIDVISLGKAWKEYMAINTSQSHPSESSPVSAKTP